MKTLSETEKPANAFSDDSGARISLAERKFHSSDTEERIGSMSILVEVCQDTGLPPESIPEAVFAELVSLAFDDGHDGRLAVGALNLIDAFATSCYWTHRYLLGHDVVARCIRFLRDRESSFSHDIVSFVLCSLMASNPETLDLIVKEVFVIVLMSRVVDPDIDLSDLIWVLDSLYCVLVNPAFSDFDLFPGLVELSVRSVSSDAEEVVKFRWFSILALAIVEGRLPADCLKLATSDSLVSLAIASLNGKRSPYFGCVMSGRVHFLYENPRPDFE